MPHVGTARPLNNINMNKTAKVIVTIVVVFLFLVLFFVLNGVYTSAGRSHTPGIIGLIIFSAAYGAIRAIWKKGNNDNSSNTTLQK